MLDQFGLAVAQDHHPRPTASPGNGGLSWLGVHMHDDRCRCGRTQAIASDDVLVSVEKKRVGFVSRIICVNRENIAVREVQNERAVIIATGDC